MYQGANVYTIDNAEGKAWQVKLYAREFFLDEVYLSMVLYKTVEPKNRCYMTIRVNLSIV